MPNALRAQTIAGRAWQVPAHREFSVDAATDGNALLPSRSEQ
jgi:hypothetical protein